MNNAPNSPKNNGRFAPQLTIIHDYFLNEPASRYMAAIATKVPIQNVCRYVEMLKAANSIAVVRKGYCRISGEPVEFLSTDPEKFPKDSQLNLWD